MIRFQRVGRRRHGSFRLVLVEKETGSRGKALEFLGSWNPGTKHLILKKDRIDYWLGKGARPSESVHNLLVREGLLGGAKIPVHNIKKAEETTPLSEVSEAPKETVLPGSANALEETKGEV